MKGSVEGGWVARCRRVSGERPLVRAQRQPAVGGSALGAGFWRRFAEVGKVIAIKAARWERYATRGVVRGVVEAGGEGRGRGNRRGRAAERRGGRRRKKAGKGRAHGATVVARMNSGRVQPRSSVMGTRNGPVP